MLITCKCLNVSICTNGTDISEVDITQLGLTSAELNDKFFKEDIGKVEVDRISKEQAALIHLRNVGNWIIHQCLNCSTTTHAIHREKGASFVVVNKGLMRDANEIIAAKNSHRYSTVFRVVVTDSEDSVNASIQSPSKFSGSRGALQTSLQQQLVEATQRETLLTEERVRAYTEQEYADLESFRERANCDHRILSRLLYKSEDSSGDASAKSNSASNFAKPLITSPNKPPINPTTRLPPPPVAMTMNSPLTPTANPNAQRTASGLVSPKRTTQSASAVSVGTQQVKSSAPSLPAAGGQLTAQLQQVHKSGSKVGVGQRPLMRRLPPSVASQRRNTASDSYDSEGLFDLEGMDENPGEAFQSGEESDTDVSDSGSHDEGIHIPRQRVTTPHVAKSVPMNVPMYVPNSRGGDESEDDRPLQDPMDIAASIKALAKSLHGDANVFGDLPRPRFSTEL